MIKVDIDIDTAENILCVVLKQQFWDLSKNLDGWPMFSNDKEENQRLTVELKEAFIKVLEYNGVYITKKRGKYTYGK